MNKICDFCSNQDDDNQGGVQCRLAEYTYNEGYGPFKQGSCCIYDSDLSNRFEPRTGEEISVKNMSVMLESERKKARGLDEKVRKLEQRLINVDA